MSVRLERVCVLTNPESGRGTSARPALVSAFTPAGIDWEVRTIRDPAHAPEMAAKAATERFDAVIACGGDGTVAAVATGMVNTGVPLGVLPCGTGNGFAGELGLPERPIDAATLYAEGHVAVRRLDVGTINGHTFLLRAGVGLIADVDRTASSRLKRRLGPLAYVVGAAGALTGETFVHYRIDSDGGALEDDAVACIVANGAAMGRSSFGIGEGIAPDDGQLDVLLFNGAHARSLDRAASALGYLYARRDLAPVPTLRGTRFTIVADPPQACVADGEDAGTTPAEVEIAEGALLVIVPRQPSVTPIGQAAPAY